MYELFNDRISGYLGNARSSFFLYDTWGLVNYAVLLLVFVALIGGLIIGYKVTMEAIGKRGSHTEFKTQSDILKVFKKGVYSILLLLASGALFLFYIGNKEVIEVNKHFVCSTAIDIKGSLTTYALKYKKQAAKDKRLKSVLEELDFYLDKCGMRKPEEKK